MNADTSHFYQRSPERSTDARTWFDPENISWRLIVVSACLFACLMVAPVAKASEISTAAPENVDPFFDGARTVEVLDWDQDGDLDIVGGAFNGQDLNLWRNQDFGWLERTFPVNVPLQDLAVGDIDGDGTTDIVYAAGNPAGTSDRIGAILNRSAAFLDVIDQSALRIDQSVCVTLLDADNDGDLDAASCQFGNGQIVLHVNAGDGENWANVAIATPGGAPARAIANDVDLDGDQDLVVITTAKLVWLENRLNEVSPSWLTHDVDSDLPGGLGLTMGDIDGDGQEEIVAGSVNPPLLAFWDRPIVVTNAWTQTDVQGSYAVADIDLRDADQDGDLDLLVTRWNPNGDLRYWQNDGSAAFSEQDLGGDYQTPRATVAADLNLDGDLDFAIAGGDSDVIDVIENLTIRSSVRFQDAEGEFRGPVRPIAFGLTDLDGDGDLDIVSYDDDERLRYRDNINDPGTLLTSVTLSDPQAFALADIDNDGDVDVVLGIEGGLDWLENNGFGNPFGRNTVDSTSDDIQDVLVVDLNHDGDLDIVGFDDDTQDLYWWRNSGDGANFSRRTIRGSVTDYRDIAAGDIDQDGRTELILAADLTVKALSLVADTAFSEELVGNSDAKRVLVEDFDLDGDLDVAGHVGQQVYLWLTDPNASIVHVATFEDNVESFQAADVDLDGDPDIFGGRAKGAVWLENFGGFFSPNVASLGDMKSTLLEFGDIDRDGDVDFIGVEDGGALQIVETVRGQINVKPTRPENTQIAFGSDAKLLGIDVEHLGRSTDESIQLESVTVTFEESLFGTSLDAAALDELFVRLYLRRDDGGQVTLSELTTLDQSSPVVFTIQAAGGAENIEAPGPGSGADSIAALEVWGELDSNYAGPLDRLAVRLTGSDDVKTVGVPLQPLTSGCCGFILDLDSLFSDRFEDVD